MRFSCAVIVAALASLISAIPIDETGADKCPLIPFFSAHIAIGTDTLGEDTNRTRSMQISPQRGLARMPVHVGSEDVLRNIIRVNLKAIYTDSAQLSLLLWHRQSLPNLLTVTPKMSRFCLLDKSCVLHLGDMPLLNISRSIFVYMAVGTNARVIELIHAPSENIGGVGVNSVPLRSTS
ncbi:hypothetical protein EDD22DRAFT_1048754 [Suillus occidentalis]|nr:hypothetical protein EDD22DRAFT_1048754 [Suillus occidentalis]